MTYNKKYRISYRRLSSVNAYTTIDILQDGYSGSVTDLTAGNQPLIITTTGNVNNIYETTKGSGAIISVVAEPQTLSALFTINPQQYKVNIFNGSDTGGTLTWNGFVNSNYYQDDNAKKNSEIQINCNDGLALLDDLSYKPTESGTTTYTGCVTISEVLQNIFSKINLTFTNIICNSDLLITTSQTNLFQNLSVNNENYYDEKGVAMSCRDVLNTIFQPLSLVMSLRAGKIYLIDPINLSNTTARSYDQTGGTETTTTLGGVLNIQTDIKTFTTGQPLNVSQNFNQIEVNYNPFTYVGDEYDFNKAGNPTGGTWYIRTGSTHINDGGNYWFNSGLTFNNIYNGDSIKGWATKQANANNTGSPTYYIHRGYLGSQTGYYTYTFPFSGIKQDGKIMLKLSMDCYVNTKERYNIIDPTASGATMRSVTMGNFEIKIGENWWQGDTSNSWQKVQYAGNKILIQQLDVTVDKSVISDTWITAEAYFPLESAAIGLLSGDIYVKMNTYTVFTNANFYNSTYNAYPDFHINNILVKNINVDIVDLGHNVIANDGIQTVLNINNATTRTKTPLSIQLNNGIGKYGSSKGAFSSNLLNYLGFGYSYSNGSNINGLQRNGSSTYYDTSKLFGQNLLSQYGSPKTQLNLNLQAKDYLLDLDKYLITYTSYFGSKTFFIVSNNYNDKYEEMQCQMIELAARDNLI